MEGGEVEAYLRKVCTVQLTVPRVDSLRSIQTPNLQFLSHHRALSLGTSRLKQHLCCHLSFQVPPFPLLKDRLRKPRARASDAWCVDGVF